MARGRWLKPEFTEDITLSEVEPLARYLYLNLWPRMDRQGLCEADPKLIKHWIFPYDDSLSSNQVWNLVEELIRIRRLFVGEFEGKRFLYCPNMVRHQTFHHTEKKKFNIPEEVLVSWIDSGSAPGAHRECSRSAPGVLQVHTGSAPGQNGNGNGNGNEERDSQESEKRDTQNDLRRPVFHPLLELWNKHRGSLRECRSPTPKRNQAARRLWAEIPDPEYWAEVIAKMRDSPFCLGENPRKWKATVNFFLRPDTHVRVMEGEFDSGRDLKLQALGDLSF